MDMYISSVTDSHPLSVRLQCVHMSLDRYREHFKGTVRTPSIASGHGYCLQAAHLESQRYDRSYRFWKGCGIVYFNRTVRWRLPRRIREVEVLGNRGINLA